MAVSSSLTSVYKDFSELSQQYRAYLNLQASEQWTEDAFTWFRPKTLKNTTDEDVISTAFSNDSLQEAARQLSSQGTEDRGNAGDVALLTIQQDVITAMNKSFARRYQTRLSRFAEDAGIQDRLGNDNGTFAYVYDKILTNTKKMATG
jgi:hypothetical protein